MPHRILCVCLGNICRSPMAEGVLRARMPTAHIDSAGTGGWHLDDPPYPPAQTAARSRGYDISAQRARQVSVADFNRFDLILAMDRSNLADLKKLAPSGSGRQIADLALFLGPLTDGPQDVPDPYYTRDFNGALDLIEMAAAAWATRLG